MQGDECNHTSNSLGAYTQLERVASMCDLNMIVDHKLTFAKYTYYVVDKAMRCLCFLERRCTDFITLTAPIILYGSVIKPLRCIVVAAIQGI